MNDKFHGTRFPGIRLIEMSEEAPDDDVPTFSAPDRGALEVRTETDDDGDIFSLSGAFVPRNTAAESLAAAQLVPVGEVIVEAALSPRRPLLKPRILGKGSGSGFAEQKFKSKRIEKTL